MTAIRRATEWNRKFWRRAPILPPQAWYDSEFSKFRCSSHLYQISIKMPHRDDVPRSCGPRLSTRSTWRGGSGRREPRGTPPENPGPQDLGKPPPVAWANRRSASEIVDDRILALGHCDSALLPAERPVSSVLNSSR